MMLRNFIWFASKRETKFRLSAHDSNLIHPFSRNRCSLFLLSSFWVWGSWARRRRSLWPKALRKFSSCCCCNCSGENPSPGEKYELLLPELAEARSKKWITRDCWLTDSFIQYIFFQNTNMIADFFNKKVVWLHERFIAHAYTAFPRTAGWEWSFYDRFLGELRKTHSTRSSCTCQKVHSLILSWF